MDSSRKSFKALGMAQPIKKQIDDTLNKLEVEKRKFLSLERQQTILKEDIQKARVQLNEAKLLQPKTRVKQNKNIQASMSINNTDRIFLNTLNKISQLKVKVDVHRKQIEKYKKLNHSVDQQIQKNQTQNNQFEAQLLKKQEKNETVKDHLMEYRTLNMRNTDQFKNSFNALHKSSIKEDNQRKKSQALRKSFNFQENISSNLINLAEMEEKNGQSQENVPKFDIYMTNCIPLVKQRVRILIHKNKQKIKISQNYKKFGEDLEQMFSVMKEYKGRDDVAFIADQLVMKQKQLLKIEQYIGKLENRMMSYQQQLQKIKNQDKQLKSQLIADQKQEGKLNDQHYVKLQKEVRETIESLQQKEHENTRWFKKIGSILGPLIEDEQINRGNVDKILGHIEEVYLNEDKSAQFYNQKSASKSTGKLSSLPAIDEKQIKSNPAMQLMNYQMLKEYAQQYIAVKK